VVVAAGNQGVDAAERSPAGAESAFAVGAIGFADNGCGWSNHGDAVNVYAPGTGITSCGLKPDHYAYMDGTSQATPHVAGRYFAVLQPSNVIYIFCPFYRHFCDCDECET